MSHTVLLPPLHIPPAYNEYPSTPSREFMIGSYRRRIESEWYEAQDPDRSVVHRIMSCGRILEMILSLYSYWGDIDADQLSILNRTVCRYAETLIQVATC